MADTERFLEKIKAEITGFEREMLTKKPEEIYYRAYEIDCMNDIYECMSEICRELDAQALEKLSGIPELLSRLYQSRLKYGDVHDLELRTCIKAEIVVFLASSDYNDKKENSESDKKMESIGKNPSRES